MPQNEVIAAGPATREEVAGVAITASLLGITVSQALDQVRDLITGEGDRDKLLARLAELNDEIETAADDLATAFDELTGWTDEGQPTDADT